MQDTPYTWQIVRVDEAARAFEVRYEAVGHQVMHVGMPVPRAGQALQDVIAQYAPLDYWREQQEPLGDLPAVGDSANVAPPAAAPVTLESARADKLAEIADWRYRRETRGVIVRGALILTDRESQAQITGAFVTLQQGFVESVDFKAAGGTWVSLTLDDITPIAQAVAQHVQECFTMEMDLAQLVHAADSIESVQAIVVQEPGE